MLLGSDALKLPGSGRLGASEQIAQAAEHGLSGLFFRTILNMSSTLDRGELRDAQEAARGLGMYLEAGIGKLNPFALPETPETRAIGDGDTLLGLRRMIEAAADVGITELWASTAGYKPYPGRFAYDRFRTDVPWTDQLAATEKLCQLVAPIARDLGVHLNIETHEELTSFELVRLVESVGPDVMGITYDTANLLQRAEPPRRSLERILPYVRQTHVKDCAMQFDPAGIQWQSRPVGQGVLDFGSLLPDLYRAHPDVNLSLEISPPATDAPALQDEMDLAPGTALYDPVWVAGHPDLTVGEMAEWLALVQSFETAVENGDAVSIAAFEGRTYGVDEAWVWVTESLAHIRFILDGHQIPYGATLPEGVAE